MTTLQFEEQLTDVEKELLSSLNQPVKIQTFLDTTLYSAGIRNRSVLNVLKDRQAHCLDGGVFAAAALHRIGFPPLIIDLLPEPGTDDDHVLALYKIDGCWGAVAKSNYVGLRYREPVYRNLRELVMSYFDVFFNVDYRRTLRSYTRPINLARFYDLQWEIADEGVDRIETYLKTLPSRNLITPAQEGALTPVDAVSYQAGMLVANPEGLYKLSHPSPPS